MVDAHAETGGCLVAAMEVPREKTKAYGILDVDRDLGDKVLVKGMVEKPSVDEAPSNLAVIGRYILTPKVLHNLDQARKQGRTGAGGEIQLTDAIAEEISGQGVYGFRFKGQRFDCGSKAGFLQATVSFAMARPELRDEFMEYLVDLVAMREAAQ
jgi:UTP--glucose-1-phosphate uridylyltransferase